MYQRPSWPYTRIVWDCVLYIYFFYQCCDSTIEERKLVNYIEYDSANVSHETGQN